MKARFGFLILVGVFMVGCLEGTDPLDWSTPENKVVNGTDPVNPVTPSPGTNPPKDEPSPQSEFQGHPGPKLLAPEEVRVEENGSVIVSLYPETSLRPRKRMNVDQLDASMRRVSGEIGWTVNGKNQFEELFATLGKPDFQGRTLEDLDPSAIFQKFLGDAARHVCSAWMYAELEATEAERIFLVDVLPDDTLDNNEVGISENLAYLLLRFHGKRVDTAAPVLNQWRWLFESAYHVSQAPMVAWNTVCVALYTHPDFYSY